MSLNGQDISLDVGFGTIPLVVYGAIGITSFIIAATTVNQITSSISESSESSESSIASTLMPVSESTPEPEAPPEEQQGGRKTKKNKKQSITV